MAGTILKLGYTNPLTDTFGAHPILGSVIDLNDGGMFTLASPAGLEISAPPRSLLLAGNIRTQGEIATRAIVRHNRTVTARLIVGPAASSTALIASIRNLLLWLAAPPSLPITLQYQPFNASTPLYLDVVGASHNLPADEGQWLRGQFEPLTISLLTRPGLRDSRVTLQNLVANPGLEQPSTAGFVGFTDTFADANLYATQAGSNPTAGSINNAYPDVVMADAPLRFYRMGESSGTTLYDASGSGVPLTTSGSPTLGVTGPISGDTNDKAVSFASASSQYAASATTTGLPSGAQAFALECWVKYAAHPATTQDVLTLGDRDAGAGHGHFVNITTTGFVNAGDGTHTVASNAALSTGAWHHLVVVHDGVTLKMYIDGVAQTATSSYAPATSYVGSVPFGIACVGTGTSHGTPASFFDGQLDEVALYGGTAPVPSAARITAHYNAGNAGTGMGTSSNSLTLPSGARVALGSPAWSSLNTWQIRLRYTVGGTYRFYLHYTDASNYLRATLTQTSLTLEHTIAGVTTTLATTTIGLASNVWYWLRLTQFPSAPGEVADVQASLYNDGNIAGTLALASAVTLGPVPSQDAITALSGRPQIEASGASLILGGNIASQHSVSLFGPGGWQLDASSAGGSVGSAAWEGQQQSTVNTYPSGPVSSFGAGRIDAPPAGAWDILYHGYNGGTPTGSWAIPCATGQQLAGSLWVKSNGLAGSASLSL
ncbi:MAG TPA: LamG domain-containing protein, partial [Ktedonobacterales bacterium]